MQICSKEDCTGCFACYNICPVNAIKMQEDEHGFIYPQVCEDKCRKCDLCKSICPVINKVEFKEIKKCYAMYAKDEEIREKSSSGGAATVFSQYILKNKGVVYGATFNKNNIEVRHIRITEIEDLEKLRGSKYVHSYVYDSYMLVKKDLLDSKKVLFIGTPCQIAGLKAFLKKEYDNLYTIDLICHGVPSRKYLCDEILYNIGKIDIDNLTFRDGGFRLRLLKDGNKIFDASVSESIYYDLFMNGLSFRENCYDCLYAKDSRISDITIGDFWGLESDSRFYGDKDKGVSVLLPITSKGECLINLVKSEIVVEERSIAEAIKGNEQLNHPFKKRLKYFKFYKNYLSNGYVKSYKKIRFLKVAKKNLKNNLKKNKIIIKLYKFLKNYKNDV